MIHIKIVETGKFHWQMGYANGEFDVDEFIQKEGIRHQQELRKEYEKYMDEPMHSIITEYWKEIGVKKDLYPGDLATVSNRRDSNYYSVLGPMELEEGRNYPVIYFSHGGGDESFHAETYGVAEYIQKEPFFYVCPNRWGAEEFERILDELLTNGYPIDESRVYAMGFSGGSASTAEIAVHSPMRVTAVALIPGANALNQVRLQENLNVFIENRSLHVPTIFIGGASDGGDSWPLVDDCSFDNYNHWMKHVAGVKDFAQMSKTDSDNLTRKSKDFVERNFGLRFHKTYINEWNGEFIYVGDFLNEDGACIARFASVKGYPHGVYPVFTGIAWEYLKELRKDTKTGKVVYPIPEMDFRTRR